MIDLVAHLDAVRRAVDRRQGDGGELVGVTLRRTYPAPVEDVWSAIVEPERLRRWFLPVTGDLRPGGSFQLEGNAGGDILACEPPRLLRVTFGGPASVVEVRLAAAGDGTELVLDHTVPVELAGGGAGALYVGPGWDGALLALGLHVEGASDVDPARVAASPLGEEVGELSVRSWTGVVERSGTATAQDVAAAVEAAMAQFAPSRRPAGEPGRAG